MTNQPRSESADTFSAGIPEISSTWLIEQLDPLVDEHPALLAYDADGTLWTGDVSDDVFLAACHENWLLQDARPALAAIAEHHGISGDGSASVIGLRLFEAGQRGLVHEQDLFAAMTICYAGHTTDELNAYAARVLLGNSLPSRLRREHEQVFVWANKRRVRCVVVSASPQPIVAWAAARSGFTPDCVIGARTSVSNGVMGDKLLTPVPFGTHKCKLLKSHSRDYRVLAAFGDSNFDFEMLACAEIAVAVSPKPELLARLLRLSRAVVLKTETRTL